MPVSFPDAEYLACLVRACGYANVKPLPGRKWAATCAFGYSDAVIAGRLGDRLGYDNRWDYATAAEAKMALNAWDGVGEPGGWFRQPGTGRRRSGSARNAMSW